MAFLNVILIGFRGSGKSLVGRELAQRLALPFVDTDDEVERASGRTIAEIFERDGEEAFRKLEREAVLAACGRDGAVVAAGGGAVENGELAGVMRRSGAVVFLSAPAEVLHARIEADGATATRRPALTDRTGLTEVEEVLARRLPLYRETAHLEFDTSDKDPRALAREIEAKLKRCGFPKNFSPEPLDKRGDGG
jgi:shikimate kinase